MGISLNGLTPAGTYPGLIKTGDNTAISGTPKVLSDGNGNNLPMEVSTTGVNLTGSPTVNSVAIANTTQLAAKQDTLVSGTNIKTINGTSVLGSGNIVTPTTPPSGVAGAIQFSNGSAFASDAANFFWDDTNNRLGIGTNAPTSELTILKGGGTPYNIANTVLQLKSNTTNTEVLLLLADNSNAVSLVYAGNLTSNNQYIGFKGGSGNAILRQYNNDSIGIGATTSPSARVQVVGSGSTSATTSLLVQNSAGNTALTVKDNLFIEGLSTINQLNFRFGPTSQGVSTRNGDFSIGFSDSTNIMGGRFFSNGTGIFWIDGLTEGASKAQNYPMVFGSRANATGSLVGSYTTEENGSQSYFGFYAAQPSAQVIINSTTRGFLMPRMTTTQINAIASPANGLEVYNTTLNCPCFYNGTSWRQVTNSAM